MQWPRNFRSPLYATQAAKAAFVATCYKLAATPRSWDNSRFVHDFSAPGGVSQIRRCRLLRSGTAACIYKLIQVREAENGRCLQSQPRNPDAQGPARPDRGAEHARGRRIVAGAYRHTPGPLALTDGRARIGPPRAIALDPASHGAIDRSAA